MTDEINVKLTQKINTMNAMEYVTFLKKSKLADLRSLKLYLDDLYYNSGQETIEDTRYDSLKEFLSKNDPEHVPGVGATLREGENRTELPFWLGSADKISPEKATERWTKKKKLNLTSFVVTDKLDGVSCLLQYKNNKFKLYTRGDGKIGADVSYLTKYIKLPKLKDLPSNNPFYVRGELIMKKKTFKNKYNTTYKNARNMVSGLIGGKTVREGLEDIDFVVYEIVGDSMPKPTSQLKELEKFGFKVVYNTILKKISTESLEKILISRKQESEYEIDGLIVQIDSPYDRNTDGNPDYLFAFKMLFEDAIHETIVLQVEWNLSKWGFYKPVVIVEPIELEGVTITRATAHNAKYVEENKLGPGAIVRITRSKDVIPYIVEVVEQAEEPSLPDNFTWDKNHVNIFTNCYDNTMCVKLISDFFSKMRIKHVSEATISKMFENGLDNLLKIISADKERLLQVPEFQEKSAERIYTNIRNGLKNVKLGVLLGASGVLGYGIGTRKTEALLLDIPNLLELENNEKTVKLIVGVEGFSELTARKIVGNIKYAKLFLLGISKYATFETNKRVSDSMKGHKYVFSGFRDKKLEKDIEERGGKVVSSVSKNTTGIIVKNKNEASSKIEKAESLEVRVYTKDEFDCMLK
jgi:DNA ligase (NAD+)